MKLYHGSNTIVKKPEILTSNRFLDFGNGFYTTANEEQARKFAVKVAGTRGGKAILNIYELDENNLNDLDVKHFKESAMIGCDLSPRTGAGTIMGTSMI